MHSHHQQTADKWDEQTLESDAYISAHSTKKNSWSGLQISLHGIKQVTKDGSYLIEMIMMDSGTTVNLFGNPNMITNRQKSEMRMNFLTNAWSKMVDE